MVLEDGEAVVYHTMENARSHHGAAMANVGFPLDDAPAIERLLLAYPDYVEVRDLPHPPTDDLELKVQIATALFREGFLVIVNDDEEELRGKGEEGMEEEEEEEEDDEEGEGEEEEEGEDEEEDEEEGSDDGSL